MPLVDPAWRRELTVFSRVELTGAAAAFTELLVPGFLVPNGWVPSPSPGRGNADCGPGPSVVRWWDQCRAAAHRDQGG